MVWARPRLCVDRRHGVLAAPENAWWWWWWCWCPDIVVSGNDSAKLARLTRVMRLLRLLRLLKLLKYVCPGYTAPCFCV